MTLIVSSCRQKPIEEDILPNIGVEVSTDNVIQGAVNGDNHNITYEVIDNGKTHRLRLEIDDHILEADVSYDALTIDFDGHGSVLTESQKQRLVAWVEDFAHTLAMSSEDKKSFSFTLLQNTLLTGTAYFSQAPPNYKYPTKVANAKLKTLGNDFLVCVKKGKTYDIRFDDRHGNVQQPYTSMAGGDNCRGLCGKGCGYWWSRFMQSWALDCLEHDICLRYLEGASMGANPDCGDEFWNCAEDFIFGRVIGGCNGKRD